VVAGPTQEAEVGFFITMAPLKEQYWTYTHTFTILGQDIRVTRIGSLKSTANLFGFQTI